jgi:hypothetical protein
VHLAMTRRGGHAETRAPEMRKGDRSNQSPDEGTAEAETGQRRCTEAGKSADPNTVHRNGDETALLGRIGAWPQR